MYTHTRLFLGAVWLESALFAFQIYTLLLPLSDLVLHHISQVSPDLCIILNAWLHAQDDTKCFIDDMSPVTFLWFIIITGSPMRVSVCLSIFPLSEIISTSPPSFIRLIWNLLDLSSYYMTMCMCFLIFVSAILMELWPLLTQNFQNIVPLPPPFFHWTDFEIL